MSCQIQPLADCGDISRIARALFISDRDDTSWLTSCTVSASSCGTILTVAYKSRLCICTAQWISSTDTNTYMVTWNGTLEDEATALLAVPICSVGTSSQDGPDWICIIVGLKNGSIAFYTNTGHLLLSEKLDDQPVSRISCHTGTYGVDPDDVHILYPNALCVLAGTSLFQTLRYAKALIARVQAGVINDFNLDGKSVTFRKWSFVDQDVINDASMIGLELKNTFDHLLSASSYGGYDTWYRSVPPHNSLIIGTGARPYLGFHYALEGGNAPPLQDVARAVASKIKSALPGWLGGGSSTQSPSNQEMKPRSEALSMRCGLCDVQRCGNSIVLSPDKRVAAVTDNLGRVSVVDVQRGVIIRMLKGQRDAQCGFVQVFEKESRRTMSRTNIKENRRALFLIIYNPKKGVLEIRLMNRCSRVTAFTAAKNGKLIYSFNGLLGHDNNFSSKKLNLPQHPCLLLDPDGKVKKISIPFHYALEGESSQRSRDLHALRKLKQTLNTCDIDQLSLEQEVKLVAESLKVTECKKHCLDILIGNEAVTPALVSTCLDIFLKQNEELDKGTSEAFHKYCSKLKQVCDFYSCIHKLYSKTANDTDYLDKTRIDIPENIKMSDEELEMLKKLLDLNKENINKDASGKVTFQDRSCTIFNDFVKSFQLESNTEYINLKPSLTCEQLGSLAKDIFKPVFDNLDMTPEFWASYAAQSFIDPKDLMQLLFYFWMEQNINNINLLNIEKLLKITYKTCLLSKEVIDMEYNTDCQWWQDIRTFIAEMPCPFRSLISAVVCRIVSLNLEREKEPNEEEAWEYVTKENAKWSILIGKLEDISILSAILTFKYTVIGPSLPKLHYPLADISLKIIYNQGKGSVSEMIARWLCSLGVNPQSIIANEINETHVEAPINTKKSKQQLEEEELLHPVVEENDQKYIDDNKSIFRWLNQLRKQFPHSTNANNLIANMCWEYSIHWQKNINELKYLEATISCLSNISDMHLSLGICTMMWSTHHKQLVESICKLVHKVGKRPKEVLCLQTIGMNDHEMVVYLTHLDEFFSRYLFFSSNAKITDKIPLEFEKIWEESVPALVEIALDHDTVNESVLSLLYQIVLVVLFVAKLNVKVNKPLNSLFDCEFNMVTKALTAKEDYSKLLATNEKKMEGPRRKFISKTVHEIVELISCIEDGTGNIRYQKADSSVWLEKMETLLDMWNMDKDIITCEQVICTYKLGYDNLAEELIPRVSTPTTLLEPLVDVCGKRLKRFVENSTDISNCIATLPPELGIHMQTLETDTSISANISLKTTASVIQSLLCHIEATNEKNKFKNIVKLAESMIYGCDVLLELNLD